MARNDGGVPFPASADELTAEWLEATLHATGAIVSFTSEPIGTGQVGDSVRITIHYDRPDAGPETVVAKFPSSDPVSRQTAGAIGLYAREVGFYREILSRIDVRAPKPFAAEIDESGSRFVLLFEDLGPARVGDQLAGCTLDDVRLAIEQAAAIHAPSMQDGAVLDAPWLQSSDAVRAHVRATYPAAHAIFRGRYQGQFAPELMRIADTLCDRFEAIVARKPLHRALTHRDFRLDNMLFGIKGGAEPIAIVDWQTVEIGCPLTDIGYLLGTGIGSALRRPHERDLLAHYCDAMSRRGVPMHPDEVWDDYRIGALHGLTTAVFSSAFVVRTDRGDANFLSMARGAAELALDHDSLAALNG